MIPLTLLAIQQFLEKEGHRVQLQEGTQQLSIVFSLGGNTYPLFLKTDGFILQLLIFLPSIIQSNTRNDMGRLLHFLNKEIDFPGFGMDEGPGVVFYRAVIPTLDGKLNTTLLNNVIKTMPQVAHMFLPIINAVAKGTLNYDSATKNVREGLKQFSAEHESPSETDSNSG